MATELYDLTVPVFVRGFNAMAAFLDKGQAHADANGIAHEALLTSRLYADMMSLTEQVQRTSDTAKFAISRLAGIEPPQMEDTETSFADLQDRIVRTIAFIESVPRENIDGQESREVELKTSSGTYPFTGRAYLLVFSLPNFFFHVTTAYAILRHNGVPLAKLDYLGS
jgi:uncharacterized protein